MLGGGTPWPQLHIARSPLSADGRQCKEGVKNECGDNGEGHVLSSPDFPLRQPEWVMRELLVVLSLFSDRALNGFYGDVSC